MKTNETVQSTVEEAVEAVTVVGGVASASSLSLLTDADNNFYSSIPSDGSRESAIKIYNAINNADQKLDDNKGIVLEIVDIVAHPIELLDEQSGEMVKALRIVLIDKEGVGYESVSLGVASSVQKIFAVVGKPSYNPPLKVMGKEQKTRKGFKTLTLALV